ncbi:MAG: APC family permease [Bacilli bacterium]|jgi:amino acid transporter
MKEKKLGLPSAVATGVGLIVATSSLLSTGQGTSSVGVTFIIAMVIACALNILLALSISELNALMPNLTGGLAQYSLASVGPFLTQIAMVGGYIICMTLVGSAECAMFGNTICAIFPDFPVPSVVLTIGLLVVLICVNYRGVDMFAKIQNVVAYSLIISLIIMGVMGTFGLGSGTLVAQPMVLSTSFKDISSLCGLAFFLFIGAEFVIPIAPQVKNAKRVVPKSMVLSLLIILVMQIFLVIGFSRYIPWAEMAESSTPHILYGTLLLGKFGTIWMLIVSMLAVISSINASLSSLSYICAGMAKINMLPAFFTRTNKFGTPVFGLFIIGGAMILINATGLSTTDQLSFLILTGSVFWMISYIFAHISVLVLRKRLPRAPRSFKVWGGIILPVIGVIGTAWMIWNISSDPAQRTSIYIVCLIVFACLALFSFLWTKYVMKVPLFKPFPVNEVMAMENDDYIAHHIDKKTGRYTVSASRNLGAKASESE